MTTERLPAWAARIAIGIVGALCILGLTVAITDRNEIGHLVQGHETRLTVLEKAEYATRSDLLQMESRLKDCLNRIQRRQECN